MSLHLLPATARDDVSAWQQTVVAFVAEEERRSGSRRTVESYPRMLWPFLAKVGSPDQVSAAHGWLGRTASASRAAPRRRRRSPLASPAYRDYYRFLTRMKLAMANLCDALEQPQTTQAVARASLLTGSAVS